MIFLEIDPDLKLSLQRIRAFPPDLLERAALAALAHQSSLADADLTLVLTGDPQIQALNRAFLGLDPPTDVLSFPADETDPETGRRYLGDIVISIPRAESQARAGGHALEAELQLLVVHGVLHLLGHDHTEAEEKARMWAAQAEVLERLGLAGIKVL
jgi:probable rRNA maturation factor